MIATDGTKIQNGFKIRGIEPPDLRDYDASTRKLYWSWVVELGLKRKDKELSQGWDKDGKPLKPISEETRKNRRSAMSPSGRGSPDAPPLTPAFQKSRTRSLLAGRAFSTHCAFFWRFDSWTGDSWAVVLSYQAAAGRDVFGLSKAGTAAVKAQSWAKWARWKQGKVRTVPQARPRQIVPSEPAGPKNSSGGTTPEERATFFRQTADATLPGRPKNPPSKSPIVGPKYNRILSHVWGQEFQAGRGGSPPRPTPAKPKPPPNKPKPKAPPKPVYDLQTPGKLAPDDVTAMRGVIESLPRGTLDALHKFGTKLVFAENMEVFDAALAAKAPRGWTPGTTFANADGVYSPSKKSAVACKFYRGGPSNDLIESTRWRGVMRHEVGHALDAALGDASKHRAFREAYAEDVARLSDTNKADLEYYLQTGHAGPEEAFAELFGQLHGGGSSFGLIVDLFRACAQLVLAWALKGSL